MYLVELRPGKEELYRTGDELAAAIRSGDVDMHSRIYHRATSKWISVTLHPQYKAIASEHPAAKPLPPMPPLERNTWTFFNDSADTLAGANDPTPEPDADDSTPDTRAKQDDVGDPHHPWRRPLALSVTGGLLIFGLQLAAAGPRPPWSAPTASASAPTHALSVSAPGALPATATVSLASSRTDWTADGQAYISTSSGSEGAGPVAAARKDSAAARLPAAPKLRSKALLSDVMAKAPDTVAASVPARAMSALVQGWIAAHDSARTRLESGIRVARLNQLFATGRLSPSGGVTETRMSLAGVANFVRVYRQQQAAIEREYQDSFTVVSKPARLDRRRRCASGTRKPATKESPDADRADVIADGGDRQPAGRARRPGGNLHGDAERHPVRGCRRRSGVQRRSGERIIATVEAAKAAGGAGQPGPMSYLLQAIGTTRLPAAS